MGDMNDSQHLKRGRRRSRGSAVRAMIAVRSKDELGLAGAEIARHLGVNTSSINRALARAEGAEG